MTSTTSTPKTEEQARTQLVPLWKVILLNDDVTTFDFVIGLLISLFRKQPADALRLTVEVHETGAAVIEVTSKERAELYLEQVKSLARPRGYPLTATMEPE